MKTLGASALVLTVLGGPVHAQQAVSASETPHITVTGSASRDVEPDRAMLTIGVTTQRAVAREALDENARVAQGVIAAITSAGIDARDVRTGTLSLQPVYDTRVNGAPPRLSGYRATNSVAVVIRRVLEAGPLLQTLADKGITDVSGPNFDISDPAPTLAALRQEAARDARRRAEDLAGALGIAVGRVLEVRTNDGGTVAMNYRASAPAMKGSVAPPVEGGTQHLRAEVTVVFAIGP